MDVAQFALVAARDGRRGGECRGRRGCASEYGGYTGPASESGDTRGLLIYM